MPRTKIGYGIDLGTSNSAVALVEDGQVMIIKSEKYQKDTTPSCVHFNKKRAAFAGDDALNRYRADVLRAFQGYGAGRGKDSGINTFIEFKRTMGTDKMYMSTHMNRFFTSEELSAEVLKKLKSFVTDENLAAAAITVPAKFRQNQIDATQRASELAGLNYCELLQEPIAASLAYGVDARRMDGYWLVFDMGGGTFDAALMQVEQGIMKVADTSGDNHLGGKDLDYAIVDHILIPYLARHYRISSILADESGKFLLREALKWHAEEVKIALSSRSSAEIYTDEPVGEDDSGEAMELDFEIALKDYEDSALPVFQRAVDISKKLLEENHLTGDDIETVLLVGGPTYSQTLRRLIREQITDRIDTHIDPMTAVARGAAIYASTRDLPMNLQNRDKTKIQLILKYPETTVEIDDQIGIRVDRSQTRGLIPNPLFVEIVRKDMAWSGGKIEMIDDREILPVHLETSESNTFLIHLYNSVGDRIMCEPSQFTIIQGIKAATATLTHSLCIGAFDTEKEKELLMPLRGLEKNQSLPANGKGVFKTQKPVFPGNADDLIKIPIYEGEPYSRTTLNEWAGMALISGNDVSSYLPEDQEIEIAVEIDSSRRMTLSAYIPYLDDTLRIKVPENKQKGYDADMLSDEILKAEEILVTLENESPAMDMTTINLFIGLNRELCYLSELIESGRGDYNTKTKVMERLREVLKQLDHLEEEGRWPRMAAELEKALERFEICHNRYGNESSNQLMDQYRKQVREVLKHMNIKAARELRKEIRSSGLSLVSKEVGLWIRYVKTFYKKFDSYNWKDESAARALIEEAKRIIVENPSKERVERIVRSLFGLLPESAVTLSDLKDDQLLKK